ncbi:MAG TPA: GntR family transcriptional regulator [Actinomycetales bacterium]|jgi:DNA-binding transcriptional regulator YhcF (GntR family)|nr:GntR family transcriptional regulator [Actinomycetales bacterium]
MKRTDQQLSTPGPLRRPRLYEQLADHISAFIEAQGLSPGDRLPPERWLANELGVSRATLSRALVALEVQGRIDVRHGDGAVVRDPAAARGDIGQALTAEQFTAHPTDELRAARESVMSGLARAAAAHPESTVRRALLEPDGTRPVLADVWRCVRRLAGPGLLAELDDAMAAALASRGDDGAGQNGDADTLLTLSAAVARGDGDAAAAACHGLLPK